MNSFALLPDSEKLTYFDAAATRLGLIPELIEKDFWVCWVLKHLFSIHEIGAHLTLKGGTSLSKCYNAIQRFSEDIDISVERTYLGFTEGTDPAFKLSDKENKKRLKKLQQATQSIISRDIFPKLKNSIQKVLGDNGEWALEFDPNDSDKQTILFKFKDTVANSPGDYIRPAVKLEIGSRGDHWPVESAEITPYVAKIIPDATTTIDKIPLRVLSAERTFWEKATILHMIHHYPADKTLPLRMSRHYYDVHEMAQTPILKKALSQIELLKHVTSHKAVFFKSTWAKYDEAKPGTLRLVPRVDQINSLKTDYRQMKQMFFNEPPSFDNIIKKVREVEEFINS